MAKLRDLIAAVAELTQLDERTVWQMARKLREAGRIKTGKTGRYGGADMTPEDAAAIMTAIIGAGHSLELKSAPETVKLCWPLVVTQFVDPAAKERDAPTREEYFGLKPDHCFGDAITAFIASSVRDGMLLPKPHIVAMHLDVEIERTPWPKALVRLEGAHGHIFSVEYIHPKGKSKAQGAEAQLRRMRDLDAFFGGRPRGVSVKRSMNAHALRSLGDLLRGEVRDEVQA